MADPTKANREAVADAIVSAAPESSALAMGAKEKKLREEMEQKQLEADKKQAELNRIAGVSEMNTSGGGQAGIPFAEGLSAPILPQAPAAIAGPAPASVAPQPQQEPNQYSGVPQMGVSPLTYKGMNTEINAQDQYQKALESDQLNLNSDLAKISAKSEEEQLLSQDIERHRLQKEKEIEERSKMKLEPRGIFEGTSTWNKILGGISLVLSAATPETTKNAINIINNATDLDLKIQENAMLSKDKSINNKGALLAEAEKRLGSLEAAKLSKKAEAFNLAAQTGRNRAAKVSSESAKARVMQVAGAAEQEAARLNQQAVVLSVQARQKAMAANQGKMINIDGFEGVAPDDVSAREFRSAVAAHNSMKSMASEMVKIVSANPIQSKTPGTQAYQDLNRLRSSMILQLKDAAKLGQISSGDQGLMDSVISDPTSLLFRKSGMERLNDISAKSLRSKGNSLGLKFMGQ